jgi:hypothetical protein
MFEITIYSPDEIFGTPIYEGPVESAHKKLVPGDYAATWYDYESDDSGNPHETIVRVTSDESDFVCLNCGDIVTECTIKNTCASYIGAIQ